MNDNNKQLLMFLFGISFGFFIKDIFFHSPIMTFIDLFAIIIMINLLKR